MADSSSEGNSRMTGAYFTHAAQVFAEVVRAHGRRPALRWSRSETTTYEELDRMANRIARLLLARGVLKRDPVCLCVDKELATYACIIACLKVGLPYFVIDPANPNVRTQTMVDRCRPALAF